jgi:hypothetical protein
VANAVIVYWLHVRFGVDAGLLGPVFAAVAVLQTLSYEASGRLSSRFGLVNTMIGLHAPAQQPAPLARAAQPEPAVGDRAPARALRPVADGRTSTPGLRGVDRPAGREGGAVAMTGAVRGVAQSFGPALSGIAIGAAAFGLPFFAAGALKILYDIGLFGVFRNRRAEHEG